MYGFIMGHLTVSSDKAVANVTDGDMWEQWVHLAWSTRPWRYTVLA